MTDETTTIMASIAQNRTRSDSRATPTIISATRPAMVARRAISIHLWTVEYVFLLRQSWANPTQKKAMTRPRELISPSTPCSTQW